MFKRIVAGALALAVPFAAAQAQAPAQEKVLKAVMHADVRVIDPVWTTQTIANIHGALVYVDPDGVPTGYDDVFTRRAIAAAHYEKVGLGADHVQALTR